MRCAWTDSLGLRAITGGLTAILDRRRRPNIRVRDGLRRGDPDVEQFRLHLSIIIAMGKVLEIGIPTKDEQQVLGKLGEELSTNLKANGNGLFVASGTWNGERQLLYRIRDPEVANRYLTDVVANPSPVRPIEYRMEKDEAWVFADKYLEPASRAPQ
jgi:hypothetical protein